MALMRLAGTSRSAERWEILCSCADPVAGHLVSPAPSMAFDRCRPGPSRYSRGRRSSTTEAVARLPSCTWPPIQSLAAMLASALADTSSREIRWTAPPPVHPLHVHSREQAPDDPAIPLAKRVPPSWFLTTLTVYSVLRAAGLLHPATDQGFVAFRLRLAPAPALPKETLHWNLDGAPRNAVHTLRRVSLADSRTASLRPLPSCRFVTTRSRRWPRPAPATAPRHRSGGGLPPCPYSEEPGQDAK